MLGADVVVVEALRFVLGKGQYLARPVGELVEAVHGSDPECSPAPVQEPNFARVYGTTIRRVPSIGTTRHRTECTGRPLRGGCLRDAAQRPQVPQASSIWAAGSSPGGSSA